MFLKVSILFCIFALVAEARHALIIGGNEAKPHEFPHMVTLNNGYHHVCGGGILNESWVVTAAHCLSHFYEDGTFQIKAGKHSLETVEDTEQVINVAKKFRHDGYPGGNVVAPHDIALLKLEKPLIFNKYVQPIALPKQNVEINGTLILSGWGLMEGNSYPDKLRRAEFHKVDFDTCKIAVESIHKSPAPVTSTMLCAGPSPHNTFACNMDSGSPLIKHEDSKIYLAGVFSWLVSPCGKWNSPSVFTKVSSYVDWIDNIMSNNE